MSYLKSKGKFVKLYDFEGLDFMKDLIKNETLNDKTLQEIKEINMENIYKENKPKTQRLEEKSKLTLPIINDSYHELSHENLNLNNINNISKDLNNNLNLMKKIN